MTRKRFLYHWYVIKLTIQLPVIWDTTTVIGHHYERISDRTNVGCVFFVWHWWHDIFFIKSQYHFRFHMMSSLFLYFGISLNLSNFFGDIYINITISGAVEIPAYVLIYFSLEKIGRCNTFIGTFSLASAFYGLAMILLVIGGQYLFLKLQQ